MRSLWKVPKRNTVLPGTIVYYTTPRFAYL